MSLWPKPAGAPGHDLLLSSLPDADRQQQVWGTSNGTLYYQLPALGKATHPLAPARPPTGEAATVLLARPAALGGAFG
ncbi:hypothetical protein [Hymenobacter sp. BRD67]|uniref:hypothetical protein n=1 Tax=Hymenobacter sp. BRD67 TaxID=2675877 RepID=UPI001563DDB5|nr:hypothetical protein [Hymenobacter sp. BRD67]QKG53636.1 hypothetical protein GKZ67_14795 [Hymenobacter sp. BRD67]